MEKQTNMRKLAILAVLALGAVVLSAASAQAQFDPAVHKLERLEPLVLGSKDNNFHMAPSLGSDVRLKGSCGAYSRDLYGR